MADVGSGSEAGRGGLGVEEDEEEDVIVLIGDDTPGRKPVSPKASDFLKDGDILCEFPPGQSPCITVTLRDYRTLEIDTFLNDIVIDFYMAWLHAKVLPAEEKAAVHIFSTMFYKRLTQVPDKISLMNSFEKDKSLSQAQIRHMRVKGWSKKVDVFSKDMIVIPICENSHWFLVIVIKPGLILRYEEGMVNDKGEPYVLVFDSLGGGRSSAVNIVREYLDQELKAKEGGPAEFSATTVPVVVPSKPEQTNFSDCGVYLLHYVEKIFTSMGQFLHMDSLPCLENWFPLVEVSRKRHSLAGIIRKLSKQQQGEKGLWPELEFLEPQTDGEKSRESVKGGEDKKNEESEGGIINKKSQEPVCDTVIYQDSTNNFLAASRVCVVTPLAPSSSSLSTVCSCSPCSRGSQADCIRRGRLQERKQNLVYHLEAAENSGSVKGSHAESQAKGKRNIEQKGVFDFMGENEDNEEEDEKHVKVKSIKIPKNVNSLSTEARPLKRQVRSRKNLALKEFERGAADQAKKQLSQNLKDILMELEEEEEEVLPSLTLKSVPKKQVDS